MAEQRSQGQHSHGVKLFSAPLDTVVPIALPGAPWLEWSEVRSINGLGSDKSETNLTHLSSPDKFKEFIAGFGDGGTLNLKLNLSAAEAAIVEARKPADAPGRAASNIMWFVYVPTWGGFYCEGFIKSSPFDVPEDGEITHDMTIKVSGKPILVIF
ncbi:MAG TPA: hypothetical protein VKE74_20220 [Gemmataceae bacterium]|nr:hypothetical protein [Gemmataceae bacterium]